MKKILEFHVIEAANGGFILQINSGWEIYQTQAKLIKRIRELTAAEADVTTE
jgi:hypothetical protein